MARVFFLVFLFVVLSFFFVVSGTLAYATPTPFPTPTPFLRAAPMPAPEPITYVVDLPWLECEFAGSGHCQRSERHSFEVVNLLRVGGLWAAARSSEYTPPRAAGGCLGRGTEAGFVDPRDGGVYVLYNWGNFPCDTGYGVVTRSADTWAWGIGGYTGTLMVIQGFGAEAACFGDCSGARYRYAGSGRIFLVASLVMTSAGPVDEPTGPITDLWDYELPGGDGGWGISFTVPVSSIIEYVDYPGGCLTIPGGVDLPGLLVSAAANLGLQVPARISWFDSDITVCLTRRVVTSVRPFPRSPNFAPALGVVAGATVVGVLYSVVRRR